ncbi:hypothetical protein ACJMK2_034172 [Sinanodonta woodiana]|uniref:Uncharacterized protein n=1 Tax=Sinanodonta woodiana TaxID=1069815 RepID=A0ABD3WQQ5_SINWO
MFTLALVLPLFVGTFGQTPTRCCYSHKFDGVLMETGGSLSLGSTTPSIADATIAISYDFDEKVLWLNSSQLNTTSGAWESMIILRRYKESTEYIVKNGQCYSVRIDHPITPPCVPDGLDYGGTFLFGSGDSALKVNNWRGNNNGTTVSINVQASDCTPVSESIYGIVGTENSVTSYIFANLKPSLSHPARMQRPAICAHAIQLQAVGKRGLEEMVEHIDSALVPFFL